MDEYGLPSYGSYIIFAFITIAIGAVLGLVMVCCIDYFWPPKPVHSSKTDRQILQESVSTVVCINLNTIMQCYFVSFAS